MGPRDLQMGLGLAEELHTGPNRSTADGTEDRRATDGAGGEVRLSRLLTGRGYAYVLELADLSLVVCWRSGLRCAFRDLGSGAVWTCVVWLSVGTGAGQGVFETNSG